MTELPPLPPTTAVADVLALRGRRGWLSPPLRRMVPSSRGSAGLVGTARTVSLRPGRGGFGPLYDLLSEDLGDQVLVVGTPSNDVAVWGAILSTAAAQVGLTAVLVDGPVRDVGECCTLAVPLWASATRTVGPAGGLEVASIGEPVDIGEVTVDEGTVVIADDDGVVALPYTDADTLLADAVTYAVAEERVSTAVRSGTALRDAYRLKSDAVARLLA